MRLLVQIRNSCKGAICSHLIKRTIKHLIAGGKFQIKEQFVLNRVEEDEKLLKI